ncbi:MAG: HEAT repeat domain-containing protein [Nostocaceae cyanobacterium]|nr:HEAT repeat domain-containing protein [Nostocaceae cyanobacterium]
MTNDYNQPQKYDAVLGGEAPPPIQGAVLGGIEGVKRRLASTDVKVQIVALNQAYNYGESGLDFLIETLQHDSVKIQRYVYKLLKNRKESQVKKALQNYKFWREFEKYYEFPRNYATSFANRKVIDFDPKIGITETLGTAYAIRVPDWDFITKPVLSTDKLKILQQSPLASQIEALVCGFWYTEDLSLVDSLLNASEQLTNLKALLIEDFYPEGYYPLENTNISYILLAYPQLEVLKVSGDYCYRGGDIGLEIAPIRHENLKALIIESDGISMELIFEMYDIELPALEYLELWLGLDYRGNCFSRLGIEELMAVFSHIFPKLKYLGLRNCYYSCCCSKNDIVLGIADSSIIENLVELDLSMGAINDEGAETLLNSGIQQLDTLDISDNCLSDEMVERLQQLDIELIADRQYRYDS